MFLSDGSNGNRKWNNWIRTDQYNVENFLKTTVFGVIRLHCFTFNPCPETVVPFPSTANDGKAADIHRFLAGIPFAIPCPRELPRG